MKKIEHPYQIPSSEKRTDIRILPFEENGIEYKYGFILLNPFYQRKKRFQDFEKEKPKWIKGSKREVNAAYKKYSWTEFLNYSGIKDIKDIFHCLYVTDHNYVGKYQKVDKKIWESFQNTIIENQLISNADSQISILIIDQILSSLQKMGYQTVRLYSLYDDSNFEYKKITDLISKEEEFPLEFRLITEDNKILFCQEYEHYETFIFSNDLDLLQSYLEITDLEGFFATDKTTLLWNEIEHSSNAQIIEIKTW